MINNYLISVVLVSTVSIFASYVHTVSFDELQSWQEIVEDEVVEILPDDFEEVESEITSPKPKPNADKGNRASPPRYKSADCPVPPNFPTEFELVLENFRNWSEDLEVADVWVTQVRTPKDAVKLANWAYVYGYKIRARGSGQSWAPVTVTKNSKCSNTILVETSRYLTQMKMVASKTNPDLRAVYVQTGTIMENLLGFLKSNRAALYASPMSGESTVGGVLATGSHGIGAIRSGSRVPFGFSAGSLSNLILSLKVVVWDQENQCYVLKKFTRSNVDTKAYLTHIGRAFITEVLLMVGPEYNMRCENRFDYTASKLLAQPTSFESDGEDLANLVEKYRAVELTVYPYTDRMWTMTCWTTGTTLPASKSRYVEKPYPYTVYENPPHAFQVMVNRFLSGMYYLSPLISRVEHSIDSLHVSYAQNEDIWGPSGNILLRQKDSVRRSTSSGYAILTTRSKVQRVASDFYVFYAELLEKYSADWKFPQNEPMQITVTGLDNAQDIPGFGKFEPPALSFLSPVAGYEYDTAICIGINSLPGTRHFESFMRELESHLFLKYDGNNGAIARPEWAKAWAFTDQSAWDNHIILRKVIPTSFGDNWDWAVERFDYYDPYNVFSNDFLDSFLKAGNSSKMTINNNWKHTHTYTHVSPSPVVETTPEA